MGYRKIGVFVLLAALTVSLSPQKARAIGVDIAGAGTYTLGAGTPTPTQTLGLPGGGLDLRFRLGKVVKLQLGGYYLTREFFAGLPDTIINGHMGLLFQLGKVFFFNFGGFYNYTLTDPLGVTGQEYGVYGGLGVSIPLGKKVAFYINPQYHYSLSTLTYLLGLASLVPHQFVGVVGIRIGDIMTR